jgi:hypothetical protein
VLDPAIFYGGLPSTLMAGKHEARPQNRPSTRRQLGRPTCRGDTPRAGLPLQRVGAVAIICEFTEG